LDFLINVCQNLPEHKSSQREETGRKRKVEVELQLLLKPKAMVLFVKEDY
jgi:primosomal replication protein N